MRCPAGSLTMTAWVVGACCSGRGDLEKGPHLPGFAIPLHKALTWKMATNITAVKHKVDRSRRAEALGIDYQFRGCTVWFTGRSGRRAERSPSVFPNGPWTMLPPGLSGAGKTTLSFAVEAEICRRGIPCYGLDGDNMRTGLNKNLGFKPEGGRGYWQGVSLKADQRLN